jgi:hypothetical protein
MSTQTKKHATPLSEKDSKRAKEVLQHGTGHLEDLASIIARTLHIGGTHPTATKIVLTLEREPNIAGGHEQVPLNRIVQHRCCATYDDGTCG